MRLRRPVSNERPVAHDFPWAQTWPEITDARLRAVFARVPREHFVPALVRSWADRDAPLPIGEGQTISQPFMVAWMTQALQLQPGDRTLEIGTGSGYQSAILCEMTTGPGERPGVHVYTIERRQALSRNARVALNALGYYPHMHVGDGALGWPAAAPFDAVIVTAAPAHLPRPLWEQLKEGGRMVAPIGPTPDKQALWIIRKAGGRPHIRNLGEVRFVPFISPVLDNPDMWIDLR
jgi:protein-L-isoaspartate(D-aspartate) O-methyltransferase